MSRTIKQKYDFPTQLCLEVSQNNIDWYRVTCDTFRAFKGPRRIQGEPYNGKVYYKGTNYIFTGKVRKPRVIEITELNAEVKKKHIQQVKVANTALKRNEKFLKAHADNSITPSILPCTIDRMDSN